MSLTGKLGKNTKFQTFLVAQLVVDVRKPKRPDGDTDGGAGRTSDGDAVGSGG